MYLYPPFLLTGPRFCLNPIKIFDGGFGGKTIWENPKYVSPAKFRQQLKRLAGQKYEVKATAKEIRKQENVSLQIEPANENDITELLTGICKHGPFCKHSLVLYLDYAKVHNSQGNISSLNSDQSSVDFSV